MTLSTSPTSDGSSALVGSSNRSTSGSIVRARAIATRWRWPPDRRDGYSSRFSLRPTLARFASASSVAALRSIFLTWIGASTRLPSTDRCGNRLNSWNTIPACSRSWRICSVPARSRRLSGWRATTMLLMSTRPAVGSSRKLRQRRNVLLPLPERPEDRDGLAGVDRHRTALEHVVVAEVLLDARGAQDRRRAGLDELARAPPPGDGRARTRGSSDRSSGHRFGSLMADVPGCGRRSPSDARVGPGTARR